jgi:hypothetical protein
MPRPRKHRPADPEEIEVALGGEIEVGLDRLLELVRRVNPSRLQHAVPEREQRYRLKARLQSRILRDFATEVTVVPTKRIGIVGIRRRGRRGDACHAVVAHLDPDVQHLVELVLTRRDK